MANPVRLAEPIPPIEHPQPVWFHPFGRPDDSPTMTLAEPPSSAEEEPVESSDVPGATSNTRFSEVLERHPRAFTPYHAKYFAHELTKQAGADQADKLAQSLSNALVAMKPHQVDAALFAFRSPLSRGAILADEVGLGKTIEAGIIVSQLWAERKRRILVLAPASLRKQWAAELSEKFFLPSIIMESKSFKERLRSSPAPMLATNQIVICSHQFARTKATEIAAVAWDLVVIDEAHRLRNVYKRDNKIARTIRSSIATRPKILLTATPLQNSLMELYGLVSFVDDHVFGSEESFRELYAKKSDNLSPAVLANLRARLAGICQRTLRKQVTAYVSYTRRIPITEDFTPSRQEQDLYERVSAYLQKDELLALPNSQRQLIELVLRKILASSSFAIAATLGTMIDRLQKLEREAAPAARRVSDVLGEDYEPADEIEEEWTDEPADDAETPGPSISSEASHSPSGASPQADLLKKLRAESDELASFKALAESITQNAKGTSLLKALRTGFEKAGELGALPKALIFTESRRTQAYLLKLLSENGYAGRIVLFNGTNTDPESKQIYRDWLKRHQGQDCVSGSPTADMRAALVEEFAQRASIMIATE
ncbi:MAG TPA: DEAD/DEAH box helicase, partial [Pirellulaceae bacterium]|nr:DEAD/DEAH box helicase [Pirellulaceae bacterium]